MADDNTPLIRPPLGIMPERYWLSFRMHNLKEAIDRIEQHRERHKYEDQRTRLIEEYRRHLATLAQMELTGRA